MITQKTSLCVTYSFKKILTQLYKFPRKLNMLYGTQKFTFLKCSINLKNSVSWYKQIFWKCLFMFFNTFLKHTIVILENILLFNGIM